MNNYLTNINLLRGFAIFTIVLSHLTGFMWKYHNFKLSDLEAYIDRCRCLLVGGNSSLFVFISGFLFVYIFIKRGFIYKIFIKNKIKKVLCPFLVVASLFVIYRLSRHQIGYQDIFSREGYLYASFWYVPFIMVMFLMSHCFLEFAVCKTKTQLSVLAISVVISIIVQRHNLNSILSVIYWTPFYLLGMVCALNIDNLSKISTNQKMTLYWLTLLMIGLFGSLPGNVLMNERSPYLLFATATPINHYSLTILFKILFCLCMYYIFLDLPKYPKLFIIKWLLEVFAKYSFSIFFLHNFVILHIQRKDYKEFFYGLNFIEYLLVCLIIAFLCCCVISIIACVIKKATGKYSRMIIGA